MRANTLLRAVHAAFGQTAHPLPASKGIRFDGMVTTLQDVTSADGDRSSRLSHPSSDRSMEEHLAVKAPIFC